MDLGFSDPNLRKNGYVKSKEDENLAIFLLNACSLLNEFDEVIIISVSHKPHIIAITESWLHKYKQVPSTSSPSSSAWRITFAWLA